MKIAIFNTAFLGDAVLTMPLIKLLKRHFADAEIHFYIRKGYAGIFNPQPEINKVIEVDKSKFSKSIALYKNIAQEHYTHWFCPHKSLRSTLASLFSKAAYKIGYKEASLSFIYNYSYARNFYKYHEIERLLQLLQAVDIKLTDYQIEPPTFCLDNKAEELADKLFSSFNNSNPSLFIAPGSVWATKRWTTSGYAYIIQQAQEHNINIILSSDKNEISIIQEILAQVPNKKNILTLAGKLNLATLLAVISKSDVFLGNDTGPMHIAYLQGVKTTAIFGPTQHNFGYYPRGKNDNLIEISLACKPCGLHGHKTCPQKHHKCMHDIQPEFVWEKVKAQLLPEKSQVIWCEYEK